MGSATRAASAARVSLLVAARSRLRASQSRSGVPSGLRMMPPWLMMAWSAKGRATRR